MSLKSNKVMNWLIVFSIIVMFSTFAFAEGDSTSYPWWVWLLIVIVIIALFFLLIRLFSGKSGNGKSEDIPVAKVVADKPKGVAKPDDLKKIEGIGPKIFTVLQEKGIATFKDLAAVKVDDIKKILSDASIGGIADPTTWPEQAKLAAGGKWDELSKLQDELKGGRRA